MKYTKSDARKKVLNCAKLYQQKLLNKKLLIIYRARTDNNIHYIEVLFRDRNFQHLTGLELVDKNGNVLRNQSLNFYRKCINNKLSNQEIQFKSDGTTPLKLDALSSIMDITRITKITGNYNHLRPYLFADKLIGGVNFCLGLIQEDDIYIPSSALLEDIKKLTVMPSQVLTILIKESTETIYSTVKHVAKGLKLNHLTLPAEIQNMVDLSKYIPQNTN